MSGYIYFSLLKHNLSLTMFMYACMLVHTYTGVHSTTKSACFTGVWQGIEITLVEICISIRIQQKQIEKTVSHFDSNLVYLNRNYIFIQKVIFFEFSIIIQWKLIEICISIKINIQRFEVYIQNKNSLRLEYTSTKVHFE